MIKLPKYHVVESYMGTVVSNLTVKSDSLDIACEFADNNRRNSKTIITVSLNGYKMASKDGVDGKWVTIDDIVAPSAR